MFVLPDLNIRSGPKLGLDPPTKPADWGTFFPRARAKGSCLVGLPLGVWIERRTMPGRAGPIEKSNENQLFFIIFVMEASKTNGFSTF